jgi:hypothetical protein
MNKSLLLMLIALCLTSLTFSQRAQYEDVSYFDLKTPNNPFEASIKTYNVVVETPYTLTVEELNAQSLADFEVEKANYANIVKQSEEDFQTQLANHDGEVKQAEAHYDKEMADFKALTLLERLALTDQGKKPQLKVPSKPVYVKPREPQYIQPNLNEHLIFDNNVLADGLELSGYEKGGDVLFAISISKMIFQDNAGKTFYSQPTNLKVMKGTELIAEKNFDDEFQFLTSSSSNTINLESYEKSNVNKIMANISKYINEEFGYVPFSTTIRIEFPKNKNREYDALENAKIKAVSAYRKLKKDASSETRTRAIEELKAVRETWKAELAKVNYTDKKAVMNNEVAKIIFFNLMRVDISLKDKAQAEETLSAMQEKRIDLNLSYDEKAAFTRLEEEIYKLN